MDLFSRGRRWLAAVVLAVACGEGDKAPTTSGESSGAASTTTTAITDLPTDGSSTASDDSGSEPDASTACLAWYAAQADVVRTFCECDVSHGDFPDVDMCIAEYLPSAECSCALYADFPELIPLMDCHKNAEVALATCLEPQGLCPNGDALQACIDQQADSILACDRIPTDLCKSLHTMCQDPGPLGQCG